MRVARLHGPRDLRLSDEPVPSPLAGESLVRVTAVGICGSDLHWWNESGIGDARLSRPLVLGHENAGVIAAGPRAGERVAIDPAIPCERCLPCREGYRNLCPEVRFAGHGSTDGGLREFLAWPSELLYPLPDALTDHDGALLEPLGVAAHAIDLGHLRLGGQAAVIGCGPIGLLLIQLLRRTGAGRVVAFDPLPHRREAAGRLGADLTADPAAVTDQQDLTSGGADVTFEFAAGHGAGGGAAVPLAIAATRPGGRVVLGGIPDDDQIAFPASAARRKGLTLALVRRMNEAYPRAIRLAAGGAVDLAALVSDSYPLAEAEQAFRAAAGRAGLKTIVEPGAGSA
jgi:L-iditol 2-dehydrogenase